MIMVRDIQKAEKRKQDELGHTSRESCWSLNLIQSRSWAARPHVPAGDNTSGPSAEMTGS